MSESCNTYDDTRMSESCNACESIRSTCTITHMCIRCWTYEWITAHIWIRHVTHMSPQTTAVPASVAPVPCHTCELGVWHASMSPAMSHVTHMSRQGTAVQASVAPASCHTCACGVSHIWMSQVTHMSPQTRAVPPVAPALCGTCQFGLVIHMNELYHTHVTHVNSACHNTWMSRVIHVCVTRMNKSCHKYIAASHGCSSTYGIVPAQMA